MPREIHLVPQTRSDDPLIWACERCGFTVQRSVEEPHCGKCGAKPCAGCLQDLKEKRRSAH